MKVFKVTPRHKVCGYTAPYMLSEQQDSEKGKQEAIKNVRQRSGLGRFECWEFHLTR